MFVTKQITEWNVRIGVCWSQALSPIEIRQRGGSDTWGWFPLNQTKQVEPPQEALIHVHALHRLHL